MASEHDRLRQIAYFLSRGPAYHVAWARWRTARLKQRLLRPGYGVEYDPDRPTGRFFFGPSDVQSVVAKVHDVEKQRTIDAADAILRYEFRFRGSGTVVFDGAIDWTLAPDGNKDWRWDLNRHGWFETLGMAWRYTGRDAYARAFESLLNDWLEKNPPAVDSVNWSSAFEVGYRINSWSWAFHLFAGCTAIDPATRDALLAGIGAHCEFLSRNLEINARNNHLLLESKALLQGAILFPGFARAGTWRKRGERYLLREIRGQVYADGVHGEMSTHYHRVIAGELLEIALLYSINAMQLPDDVEETIERMADFENCVTRPDGSLPLIGDSAADDTYARLSARVAGNYVFGLENPAYAVPDLDERCHWRLANVPQRTPRVVPTASRSFPQGGFYVMRSGDTVGSAMHAVVNCGPFGLPSDPHHGHADSLSLELFANGRPWIVDAGVYSTHADWRWRRYFRGTRGHNTVMVDGADQAVLIDSRRATQLPAAHCSRWETGSDQEVFDGWHDGYRRLGDDIVHRRIVHFVRGRCWVIVDGVFGRGSHGVELMYHCPDDVRLRLHTDDSATLLDGRDPGVHVAWAASRAMRARIDCGETDPVQGWYSKFSGQKNPAPTLVLACETSLPVVIATAVVPNGEHVSQFAVGTGGVRLTLGDDALSLPLPSPDFSLR